MDERYDEDDLRDLLRRAAPVPPFPRETLRRRIEATVNAAEAEEGWMGAGGARWFGWQRAAAALLLFVAGIAVGRGSTFWSPGGRPAERATEQAMDVSLRLQRRGTQFVGDLAHLRELRGQLSPEQLEAAREVAAAALYGAALELLELDPDDATAASLLDSLVKRRRGGRGDGVLLWQ